MSFPLFLFSYLYVHNINYNRLEQVEGAATKPNESFGWAEGDAWGYRRKAYQRMIALLQARGGPERNHRGSLAERMYGEVFGAESFATKKLHQLATPPMSEAAREAKEVFESYQNLA